MDNMFITVTNAGRAPPTPQEFDKYLKSVKAKDRQTANPVGKAMRRVTAYAGNTILEMGKFKLGPNRLVYIIKRTTMIELGSGARGQHAKDEDEYEIPESEWKSLCPPTTPGHDSWWRRLNDLVTSYTDRAYHNVKARLEELGLAQQLVQWAPRPDIQGATFTVPMDMSKLEEGDDCCPICATDYDGAQGGEPPVELPCGHHLCLLCVESQIDAPLAQKERQLKCPMCREPVELGIPRDAIFIPSEIPYQRWKYMDEVLNQLDTNWQTYIGQSVADEYIPDIADEETFHDAKCYIVAKATISWMNEIVKFAHGMLPYGYSLDNPTTFRETEFLHAQLAQELLRLEAQQREFTLQALTQHLTAFAAQVVKPVVAQNANDRLGNPIFAPGYERYMEFLVKRVAQGAFLSYGARLDICKQVQFAMRDKGIWWKNMGQR